MRRVGRVTRPGRRLAGLPGRRRRGAARLASRLGAAWALLDGRRAAVLLRRAACRGRWCRWPPPPRRARHARRRDRRARRRAAHRRSRSRSSRADYRARVRLPLGGAARAAPRARRGPRRPAPAGRAAHRVAHSRLPASCCRRSAPPAAGFGEPRTYTGVAEVESRDRRAVRASATAGSTTRCPPAPRCARPPPAPCCSRARSRSPGETVVIDHGQGVVSVLQPPLAASTCARATSWRGAAVVGLSGDSGLAPEPHAAVARLPPRRRRGPDGDRPLL